MENSFKKRASVYIKKRSGVTVTAAITDTSARPSRSGTSAAVLLNPAEGSLLGPSRSRYTWPRALMWLQIESAQTPAHNHTHHFGAGSVLWSPPQYERIHFQTTPPNMLLSFKVFGRRGVRSLPVAHFTVILNVSS